MLLFAKDLDKMMYWPTHPQDLNLRINSYLRLGTRTTTWNLIWKLSLASEAKQQKSARMMKNAWFLSQVIANGSILQRSLYN